MTDTATRGPGGELPPELANLRACEAAVLTALEAVRSIDPEAWQRAEITAMRSGWHTVDLIFLGRARQLSLLRGGRQFSPCPPTERS